MQTTYIARAENVSSSYVRGTEVLLSSAGIGEEAIFYTWGHWAVAKLLQAKVWALSQ
jgi:hypothetical protein